MLCVPARSRLREAPLALKRSLQFSMRRRRHGLRHLQFCLQAGPTSGRVSATGVVALARSVSEEADPAVPRLGAVRRCVRACLQHPQPIIEGFDVCGVRPGNVIPELNLPVGHPSSQLDPNRKLQHEMVRAGVTLTEGLGGKDRRQPLPPN